MQRTLRQLKRFVVALVGGTILLLGIAMLVLPGPAIVVIPLGLGILATEFVWARHLFARLTGRLRGKGKQPRMPE